MSDNNNKEFGKDRSPPTRLCQTCGLSMTLDHFISLYTESSTANCDFCRKKQREMYKRIYVAVILIVEKQLKKKKMKVSQMQMQYSLNGKGASKEIKNRNHLNQREELSVMNDQMFSSFIFPIAYQYYPVIYSTPCIPSLSWIPCDYPTGDGLVCVAKVINTTKHTSIYRSLYV